MSVLQKMLEGISIPRMIKVEQHFKETKLDNVAQILYQQLSRQEISSTLRPGMRIAIGVGRRGLRHIDLIVREPVAFLKAQGAETFVIPAMGSHGGATAEGQAEILKSLGVSETSVRKACWLEQLKYALSHHRHSQPLPQQIEWEPVR